MAYTFSRTNDREAGDARATARALIALPLMVAAAGGRVEEADLERILGLCAFNPLFRDLGPKVTEEVAGACLTVMHDLGSEELFTEVLDHLTPETAETAMCFAVGAALADGPPSPAAKTLLRTMGQRLGLPEPQFVRIFEVMAAFTRRRD